MEEWGVAVDGVLRDNTSVILEAGRDFCTQTGIPHFGDASHGFQLVIGDVCQEEQYKKSF